MNTKEILKLALIIERIAPFFDKMELNQKLADALTDDWQERKKHDFIEYCLKLLEKHTTK